MSGSFPEGRAIAGHPHEPWLRPDIADYVDAHATPPDPLLIELVGETERLFGRRAGMQITSSQGALMSLLASMTGARRGVEIGTFTGYSSIVLARALGPDGHLLCLDTSIEWTDVARGYWERAGLADRIELRVAAASETLAELDDDIRFDLAFVDADKVNYLRYFEVVLKHMDPGGVMMFDNTLWSGRVTDPSIDDADTCGIRVFNDAAASDARVDSFLLPVSDGLTIVRVR